MTLEQTVEKLRTVIDDEWRSHDERRLARESLTALTEARQDNERYLARWRSSVEREVELEAEVARLTAENASLEQARLEEVRHTDYWGSVAKEQVEQRSAAVETLEKALDYIDDTLQRETVYINLTPIKTRIESALQQLQGVPEEKETK